MRATVVNKIIKTRELHFSPFLTRRYCMTSEDVHYSACHTDYFNNISNTLHGKYSAKHTKHLLCSSKKLIWVWTDTRVSKWIINRIVCTSAYLATELASTAYTFLAPAWTAKKDNIPVPQPTSRTTYKHMKYHKNKAFSRGTIEN